MSELPPDLSPMGQRRREEILQLALQEGRNRRHGRVRRVGLIAGGMMVAVACWAILGHGSRPLERPAVPHSPVSIQPQPPAIAIVFVDPNIADKWAVKLERPSWKYLTDEELLRELAAANQPAALESVDGKTRLLTP